MGPNKLEDLIIIIIIYNHNNSKVLFLLVQVIDKKTGGKKCYILSFLPFPLMSLQNLWKSNQARNSQLSFACVFKYNNDYCPLTWVHLVPGDCDTDAQVGRTLVLIHCLFFSEPEPLPSTTSFNTPLQCMHWPHLTKLHKSSKIPLLNFNFLSRLFP